MRSAIHLASLLTAFPRSGPHSSLPNISVATTMATTSPSEPPTKTSDHRTNSLAFAKTDCHTCSELKRWCDRQRPRCGTCSSHRRKCGGFVLDFTWKKPREVPSPNATVGDTREPLLPDSQKLFKFKKGRPRKKRRTGVRNDEATAIENHFRRCTTSRSGSRRRSPLPDPNSIRETDMDEIFVLQSVTGANSSDNWVQPTENSLLGM
jgi:hypothetical protein